MRGSLTGNNHRACNCVSGSAKGREVHVHGINDVLEIEGYFDIQYLVG